MDKLPYNSVREIDLENMDKIELETLRCHEDGSVHGFQFRLVKYQRIGNENFYSKHQTYLSIEDCCDIINTLHHILQHDLPELPKKPNLKSIKIDNKDDDNEN